MTTPDQETARGVARDLFTNGLGQEAQRLVLELPGGRDGGGWCQAAIVDRIAQALAAARAEARREAATFVETWARQRASRVIVMGKHAEVVCALCKYEELAAAIRGQEG